MDIERTAPFLKSNEICGKNSGIASIEQVDYEFVCIRMLCDVIKHVPMYHFCIDIGVNAALDRDVQQVSKIRS